MDNKKIFDILPPGNNEPQPLKKKEGFFAQKTEKKEEKKREVSGTNSQSIKTGLPFRKKIIFLIVFLLIIFVATSNFIFNKAEVKIWPQLETVSLEERVLATTEETAIDLEENTIPAKIFTQEQAVSQQFAATGQTEEGQKASGIIRVYNNYSESSQVLVKNTRFISSDGKLFRTTEKITVPGGTYVKGKLEPGFIDVSVVADEPGEDYNIGPSTFSIPGFVGTAKYTAFYGKSSSAMSGGFAGEATIVTKDDLDGAKKSLSEKAVLEGKTALKNKIPDNYVLLDEAINSEIIEATSSLLAGNKAEKFTYQVKARLEAVAFEKSNLENFSRELILLNSPANKEVKEGSLDIAYGFDSSDVKAGKLFLDVNFSSEIYSSINKNSLSQDLAGESLARAQEILTDLPEITKAQIKSWPFWLNSVPQDTNKIEIKLMLDPVTNLQ